MRAVLDTNIIVSALIWGGKPFTLLQAATDGELQLFTSPALLEDLRDVLTRGHLAPLLERRSSAVTEALSLYAGLATCVTPMAVPQIILEDPEDDQVIATAVPAEVDPIVSGDRHLLTLGSYGTIRVVTPADAIAAIGFPPATQI